MLKNHGKKNTPLYENLINDVSINKKISNKELGKMFEIDHYTKKINIIFKRVFK